MPCTGVGRGIPPARRLSPGGSHAMNPMRLAVCCVFSFAFLAPPALAQDAPARVTVLYDAFGKPSALKRGWGYSALVEYGGKRGLLDTGGNLDECTFNG